MPAFLTDARVTYLHQCSLLTLAFLTDTGIFHTVAGVIPKPEPLRQARSSVRLPLSLWQLHCGCWASCHSLTRICNQYYGSGFESRRHFIPTPVFLTNTGVFSWHRHFLPTPVFSYWHRRFLLTPAILLTPAFLTDTGISYWYRCSAQTRTGIGLLEKPPAEKRFPAVESHLGVRASYATRRKRRY